MPHRFRTPLSFLLMIALAIGSALLPLRPSASVSAQDLTSDEPLHTDVKFELLLSRERTNGLAGQQWAEIFRQLEVPVRVRQPLFNDKSGIEQQTFGTTRRVTATGLLDPGGDIVFPDRRFSRNDVGKLREWIEELRTYGAQGAPTGQPLWGMTQAQFDVLHAAMQKPVEASTKDLDLTAAIVALGLPEKYPLTFSVAAKAEIGPVEDIAPVKNDVTGFAKGTAFALLLREYGVAFSPKRLPDESVILQVETAEEIDRAWPIGWDPDSLGLSRLHLARDFFLPMAIEIDKMTMTQMLDECREATKLPVLVDGLALDSLNYDFNRIVVDYPRRRTSWSLALRTLVGKLQLTQELRVDENNKPFVWITRFQNDKDAAASSR
ncbi:hypothetical protein [Rubinisphaera margarita]|uniref:hypothetical protein n=1 Tax=Rubinisphaera margarita TaxID=2909586 RepID=UPI001EE977E9|nr:hypothetical protein [Rubinisphaera margarita]MCG6157116.1 hypothetical protein [Rubinisphaera margarita]